MSPKRSSDGKDRVIVHGSLPGFGYSAGMTSYLTTHGIRVFDYTKFAEPLRAQLRGNAERLAEDNGLQILFLRRSNVRKEAVVEKLLAECGKEPGLVCILSALETCQSYKLADSLDVRELHSLLDRYARKCCPALKQLGVSYHW